MCFEFPLIVTPFVDAGVKCNHVQPCEEAGRCGFTKLLSPIPCPSEHRAPKLVKVHHLSPTSMMALESRFKLAGAMHVLNEILKCDIERDALHPVEKVRRGLTTKLIPMIPRSCQHRTPELLKGEQFTPSRMLTLEQTQQLTGLVCAFDQSGDVSHTHRFAQTGWDVPLVCVWTEERRRFSRKFFQKSDFVPNASHGFW